MEKLNYKVFSDPNHPQEKIKKSFSEWWDNMEREIIELSNKKLEDDLMNMKIK